MSGQPDTDEITSLETLFLSREFGHPTPDPAKPEGFFMSREIRRPWRIGTADLRLAPLYSPGIAGSAATGLRVHPTSKRTVAAVSGVAAAALALAGFAVGTARHSPSGLSALGSRTRAPGGAGAMAHVANAPGPAPGSSRSGAFVTATTVATHSTAPASPRPPVVVAHVPSGTTVAAVVPTPSASPSGGAPSAGPPGPAPGATNPFTPVITVATSTAGTVASAVSTASGSLASALPSTAPATAAAGSLGSAITAAVA